MASGKTTSLLNHHLLLGALTLLSSLVIVKGESPYKFYTWTVTYGIISPLGVPQQVQTTTTVSIYGNSVSHFCLILKSQDLLYSLWMFCLFVCLGYSHQWSVSWSKTWSCDQRQHHPQPHQQTWPAFPLDLVISFFFWLKKKRP